MNLSNTLVITFAVLTAAGLFTWAGLAVTQVMDELRTFDSFEGMHFEE